MSENFYANLNRELEKLGDTLDWVLKYLESTSEANAALHLSDRVMYSPLASKVHSAIQDLHLIRIGVEDQDESV